MTPICRIQWMEEKRYAKIYCMKNSLECRNNLEKICAFHIAEKFDIEQLNKLYFTVISL